jgi:hypothetical protein
MHETVLIWPNLSVGAQVDKPYSREVCAAQTKLKFDLILMDFLFSLFQDMDLGRILRETGNA